MHPMLVDELVRLSDADRKARLMREVRKRPSPVREPREWSISALAHSIKIRRARALLRPRLTTW